MSGRILGVFSGVFLTWAMVAGCAAQTAAPTLPGAISARERSLLAESFVAERLWVWQKQLKLEGWKITAELTRASELRPKTLGNIHWDLAKKTAVIHVLDPADYQLPVKEMLDDMEFTVVHELIHLEIAPVLSDLQRSDANRREEEHAVNQMAAAFLALNRGK